MTIFQHSVQLKNRPRQQRGAATLVVSLVLLFGMTLVAFFANRSMIFEQKTSANQLRSTKAFEAADAGIEWAISMLNDNRYINASCTTTGTNTESFRKKYLNYDSALGFRPIPTEATESPRLGCSISAASESVTPTVSCSCPASGTNPTSLSSATSPTFTVKFEPTSDKESIKVISFGCTSADGRCVPGSTATADAYQSISAVLKLRPSLKSMPAAAITTGGSVKMTSAASSILNTDPSSNGTLVNAGGTVNNDSTEISGCNGASKPFATAATLPGLPWQNAMIEKDESLRSLSDDADAMFSKFFGTTLEQFKTDPTTKVLSSCGSVESDFAAEYAKGNTSFYTTCDFQTTNDMGSTVKPVIFVTTGQLKFNGGADIHGLVYGDHATWDSLGLGNGSINGALIVRGNYCANANAEYNYNADALNKIRASTGSLARVPGSWKDF